MEDVGKILRLDASRQLDFEKSASVIECDDEEGRSSGDGWRLRIELLEILLSPLIDSIRVYSLLEFRSTLFFFFLFLHF